MKISIRGDKITITKSIKDYISEKLGRLDKYFENPKDMLDDDGEVIILKVSEENDDFYLSQIESEEEYEQIAEIFEDRLSELFDGAASDDDDE